MRTKPPKFVLDTQLFIRAFRDAVANEALQEFHRTHAPFEYLSSVVAQELLAGIRGPEDRRALERNVLNVYARAGRLITPSANAWERSGDVLAAMMREEGLEIARVSKSFANDVLLALSCRESGCVLVSENQRDFSRIQQRIPFECTVPWP
ncbi:MAG: PIN domain-containing protein [Bryobacterales bacterium]|nr:PIN domain-containing protein [Bryobacterales bacterium]